MDIASRTTLTLHRAIPNVKAWKWHAGRPTMRRYDADLILRDGWFADLKALWDVLYTLLSDHAVARKGIVQTPTATTA